MIHFHPGFHGDPRFQIEFELAALKQVRVAPYMFPKEGNICSHLVTYSKLQFAPHWYPKQVTLLPMGTQIKSQLLP